MKRFKPNMLTLSLAVFGACASLSSAHAQLLFSQYVDGNSNKKGLEIFNPDNTTANLSEYQIQQFSNGATTATATFTLEGNLASQGKYLVGRSELKTELDSSKLAVVNQVVNLSFNGDDALVLLHKGIAVDRFGRVGERPEGGWGTTVKSTSNSFSRTNKTNRATSIDPTTAFDLGAGWTAWTDRNLFSNLIASSTPSTPTPPANTPLNCSTTDTPIADLRSANAEQQKTYTVRGIITADYRYSNGFSGLYIQTPDNKAKPNISNAMFVFIPATSTVKGGQVGDEVILQGRLTTFQNQLQLDNVQQDIQSCAINQLGQITPKSVELPFASLSDANVHSPTRYQGMWVKLPQTLTVSENFNYGRFGELSLSLGRLYIPTNLFVANSAEAKATAQKNLLSKIILDDGYNNQNRTPWLPSAFNAKNTLRSGYNLNNVTGIMEYRFNNWRVQPIQNAPVPTVIASSNPRASLAAKNRDDVRVAAFNVLNYDNGSTGFPTERGASSQAEFDKQHQKILAALKAIDADVYALMEIANNGYDDKSAIAYLTRSLGADWKYITPNSLTRLGGDAIAVGIIYNSQRVKPFNKPAILDLGDRNRTTLAQSFQQIDTNTVFTVVPNHLKSKSCGTVDAASLDADQKDGQSCWNNTRVKAVEQLITWIASNPTQVPAAVSKPNFLVLGDMNSYAKEDPMQKLEQAQYKLLLNDGKVGQGSTAYTYVFGVSSDLGGNGGAGNLDHAIADPDLYSKVSRTFAWPINADEPTALGYDEEFKTDEQKLAFYAADAYRSSDHDPVIVDMRLKSSVTFTPITSTVTTTSSVSGGGVGLWALLGLGLLGMAARMKTERS